MKLTDLKKGDLANIISINANKILKNRFASFGINKGANFSLEEYSFSKKTLEIKINKSRIALRVNEAQTIEVQAC
ncbi:MAG: ferrous iron transport protein A [Campylobacteraceae bacterium]|nr:ferrous iron transport protein A [Campylobacteraceae bacterium]